ncbi:MAG: hypothetical protein H6622_13280 [Halobacteriovoraceae bacterium]|nr:hypothetical protein [Halobacteriovoraceae bacterium]
MSNIIYVGTDAHFWQNLVIDFKTIVENDDICFHFVNLLETPSQLVVKKIVDFNPSIIYFDYTSSGDISQYIKQTRTYRTFNNITTVFLNKSADEELCKMQISEKVHLFYTKEGDFGEIIYGPLDMTYPYIKKRPKYSKAVFDGRITLQVPAKVYYATSSEVIVDHVGEFNSGTEFDTYNFFVPKSILPSQKLMSGNSYNGRPGFFANVFNPITRTSDEMIDLDNLDESSTLNEYEVIQEYKDYIKRNSKIYFQNNTIRAIVISPELSIGKNKRVFDGDKHYTYEIVRTPREAIEVSKVFKPHIIAFEYNHSDMSIIPEEQRTNFTGNEGFKYLLNHLNEFGFRGNFLVFGLKSDQILTEILAMAPNRIFARVGFLNELSIDEEAQKFINIIKTKQNDRALEAVKKLKKIDPKKYLNLTPRHLLEDKCYFSMDDRSSMFALKRLAYLTSITESVVTLSSDIKFKHGDVVIIESPVKVFLTIIDTQEVLPIAKKREFSQDYKCLISFTDENKLKALRRFVNIAKQQTMKTKK